LKGKSDGFVTKLAVKYYVYSIIKSNVLSRHIATVLKIIFLYIPNKGKLFGNLNCLFAVATLSADLMFLISVSFCSIERDFFGAAEKGK